MSEPEHALKTKLSIHSASESGRPAMPDKTDPPAVRPIVKLRDVSMREGPPNLLPHRRIERAPGSWVTSQASLSPEPMADEARTHPLADRAPKQPAVADTDRPFFTRQHTPRPAEPVRQDSGPPAMLPRTRYRLTEASTEETEVALPPTPSLAVRQVQRHAGSRLGKTAFATPSQALDQAVRQRLWDPFAFRRRKAPPAD